MSDPIDTLYISLFYNILEISTGAFYIKIMRFFRVQIHSWNVNISWILHLQFTSSERGVAWYWTVSPVVVPLLYYASCSGRRKEENCRWGMGEEVEEIDQSSLTRKKPAKRIIFIFILFTKGWICDLILQIYRNSGNKF